MRERAELVGARFEVRSRPRTARSSCSTSPSTREETAHDLFRAGPPARWPRPAERRRPDPDPARRRPRPRPGRDAGHPGARAGLRHRGRGGRRALGPRCRPRHGPRDHPDGPLPAGARRDRGHPAHQARPAGDRDHHPGPRRGRGGAVPGDPRRRRRLHPEGRGPRRPRHDRPPRLHGRVPHQRQGVRQAGRRLARAQGVPRAARSTARRPPRSSPRSPRARSRSSTTSPRA